MTKTQQITKNLTNIKMKPANIQIKSHLKTLIVSY